MSDLKQIHGALSRLYDEEGQRIVFWNDPEGEFTSLVGTLDLSEVKVLRLDQFGALEVKIRVEREEPATRFLLYSPANEPDFEDDWLLDIRLYSRSFRADRASILLQELGLANASLRTHVAERRKFFDAKDRLQKIKTLIEPEDSAADIDLKMIAVVTRADQPQFFNILITLFHAWGEPGAEIDLDIPPGAWSQVEKFELDQSFWLLVKGSFGYEEENPSLKNLLLRLMLTDFAHHLRGEVPVGLRGLLLPKAYWTNVVFCMAHWRDSSSRGASHDRLSELAAAILNLSQHLPAFELDQLLPVMTFLEVEKRIASHLRERVQTTAETINADEVREIANKRQSGHWATQSLPDGEGAPRKALHAVYEALVAAADFLALRNLHKAGFDYPNASAMYKAYETDLYKFDLLYRHFCESADQAESAGWNIVKNLRPDIEAHYVNWYLANLSVSWGRFMEGAGGLLAKWRIDGVPNQQQFFERNVRPWLDVAENRRAYVIISDAFRYEAASELTTELNGKYRFEATLGSQLGVLPSYTALGMASLLPHRTLAYKGTDVLVDGRSSVAGERDAILQTVGGLACSARDLMAKKKEEGREFVQDKRVVYIYHNTVDAVGDDGKTEGKTFGAVRTAIEELAALVGFVVNNLQGHHIVVTADHGFLFTESPRTESDKSKLRDKPESTILAKKRYVIAPSLPEDDAAWRGKLSVTAGAGDMEFWIPKGVNLFHFVGGARYVHGGAMPQEIVVPVVTVKHLRGKTAQERKSRPADVTVLGSGTHRITSSYSRFQLMQMEPVGDRVTPVTLRVAIYEGDEPVTDIQTIRFESASANLDDRKKWVNLVLKERQYNKKTTYRLVLKDADLGVETYSAEVIIDRAFNDDF